VRFRNKDEIENYDRAIRSLVRDLDIGKLDILSRGTDYAIRGVSASSLLVILLPGERRRFLWQLIASYIRELIMEAFLARHWDELYLRFSTLDKVPQMDTASGWLWDGFCHARLPLMAEFDVTELATGDVVHLSSMPTSVVYAHTAKTKDAIGHYRPTVRNQPTFDAFSITDQRHHPSCHVSIHDFPLPRPSPRCNGPHCR
jgi:hypothetical protein